jgi:hypothetical protein
MNNQIKKGQAVVINVDGYGEMVGIVARVIKVVAPFGPESDNPNDWTYHVNVDSTHPRNSGTFQVKGCCIKQPNITLT